jgi:hypothetical protein
MHTITAAPPDWARLLKEYTQRHAGRRARLEFDDPDLGAQWAEIDFPLRGISYDRRDDRIEIMLGEIGSLEERLTHSIVRPCALDILLSERPTGEVLCISHPDGQTRLHLVPG